MKHKETSPPENKTVDVLSEGQPAGFQEGESVQLVIGEPTALGFRVRVNDTHWGMLYENEVFQPLRKGQCLNGFIRRVRDDGKIDLCLHKPGPEKVNEVSDRIMDNLSAAGGFLPLTDKTPPETIYGMFGVSKKTYKKAIGALYKKRLIIIESGGIKLNR